MLNRVLNRRRLLLGATALAATATIAHGPFAALTRAQAADSKVDEEVTAWIKANALPLASVEPGSSFDDLAPLRPMLSKARIVSMGEATHGTREFFQLKHRLIEYCVSELGFTIIGIEASYTECLRVNDYVLHGTGNPAEALAGTRFWVWDTEEVL